MKQAILGEAVSIGDQLLAIAERQPQGMSWSTMSIDSHLNISWKKSEDIYSGVSGIIIFLLELARQTNDSKYLNAAIEGMRWTENYCETYPADNFNFFAGRAGVCYSLIKMFEATADRECLRKALSIARPCVDDLRLPPASNDLLTGTAGTLLGLLHLHAATDEPWVLEAINTCIRRLVDEAECGHWGLYWDRSPFRINGLCGFSHGAAGIGFALLEAGSYLKNKALYWLADQAFAYESRHFDPSRLNWPDFRVPLSGPNAHEEYEKEYRAGNLDLLNRRRNMNAWCHGAVGIGLSRVRLLQLVDRPLGRHDLEAAVDKTLHAEDGVSSARPNFTLCHGKGGEADLFLECYRLNKDRAYLSYAEKIVALALASKANDKFYLSGTPGAGLAEDVSLFGGIAGIGYFYLRVLNPLKTPSILLPSLKRVARKNVSARLRPAISLEQARRAVINKIFRRTLFVAEEFFAEEIAAYFSAKSADRERNEKEVFTDLIASLISSLPPGKRRRLVDIFSLERQKIRIDKANANHFLLHIEEVVHTNEAQRIARARDDVFINQRLALNPKIKVKTARWMWSATDQKQWQDNLRLPPATHRILLTPTPEGVIEEPISSFSFIVLNSLRKPDKVKTVIKAAIRSFGPTAPQHRARIRHKMIEQIRTALRARIVVRAE